MDKSEIQEQLKTIYSILKNRLILKKKLKNNSILISIMNVKSNEAFKLLSEGVIKRTSIAHNIFDYLVSNQFIRMADKTENYTITVKGIWEIESKNGTINTDILLEYIDKKFFDLFKEIGKLTEKEKIILLSMIAVRSFSSDSALDLKKGKIVLKSLEELINDSYNFLHQNRIISKIKSTDLFGAQGNEHPVSHLIRHTDALLKRTRGIYKTLGKQKYYLDLLNGNNISKEGLVLLFDSIFDNHITPDLKEKVSEFCIEHTYSQSKYLFDLNVHIFAHPMYDEQFNEALENYYINRYKPN
jgi:hypothetical protein